MRSVPKGYHCPTCGTFHEFDAYVYAHTHMLLTHHCGTCGEDNVLRGTECISEPDAFKKSKYDKKQGGKHGRKK